MRIEAAQPTTRILSQTWLRCAIACLGLGSAWGIAEATLGQRLHMLAVPLAGELMIPIGIGCCLGARRLLPTTGIVTGVGAAAAFVRLFAPGPLLLMPSFAILLEAMLMEACLSLVGDRRRGSFMLTGAISALYPLAHGLIAKLLIFSLPLATIYAGIVSQVRLSLRAESLDSGATLAAWIAVCLAVGALSGLAVTAVPSRRGQDERADGGAAQG